ncbi:hypothetical protein GWK47_033998 [Chionoecetes opilio]|uniref:Reverse transcriptase n=1 Tax=Chionoecetes opilio TaxID=41210 RepID=A0A8J5D0X0_CHIOP|nr:hypothetical protein GWK47_033998 [Chionoecetes opilio]
MQRVQRVAQQRWQNELKFKLSDRSVGSKSWWTALKEQQGFAPDDHIPPLNKADGSVATRSCEKAEVLTAHFSGKMTVSDPDRLPPAVARLTNATLDSITLTTEEVKRQLQLVDPKKALGPDGVSPHILKHCAAQLAAPVTDIFQYCLSTGRHPSKAAGGLNCVRRVSHLLDARGVTTIYAAQVCSLMEYAPLTWSSCPPSYLGLLDKVQNRAQPLISPKAAPDIQPPPLQPLQHRRDWPACALRTKSSSRAPRTSLHPPGSRGDT